MTKFSAENLTSENIKFWKQNRNLKAGNFHKKWGFSIKELLGEVNANYPTSTLLFITDFKGIDHVMKENTFKVLSIIWTVWLSSPFYQLNLEFGFVTTFCNGSGLTAVLKIGMCSGIISLPFVVLAVQKSIKDLSQWADVMQIIQNDNERHVHGVIFTVTLVC